MSGFGADPYWAARLQSQLDDMEWQLKGRLVEVERQLAELRDACGMTSPGGRRGTGGRAGAGAGPWQPNGGDDPDMMSWIRGPFGKLGLLSTEASSIDSAGPLDRRQARRGDPFLAERVTADQLESEDYYELKPSLWDCCLFVGFDCMGPMVSTSLVMLIFTNMVVQILFCGMVYQYLLDDPVRPEVLDGLVRFRTGIAHDVKLSDQVLHRSLASQVCAQDAGLPWANQQTSMVETLNDATQTGVALCLLCMSCWLAMMLKEVVDTLHFVRAILQLPRGHTVVTWHDDAVEIRSISRVRLFLMGLLVVLPRIAIAAAISLVGMGYLRYTISLGELILNAMALTFIIEIDEMFYNAFAPRRVKSMTRLMKSLPLPPYSWARKWGSVFTTMKLFIVAGILFTLYVSFLMPFYERIQQAKEILCGGNQDFVYAVPPNTGLVETTISSKWISSDLSETQLVVLGLAGPSLKRTKVWELKKYAEVSNGKRIAALQFPSPQEFANDFYDMHAFNFISQIAKWDVIDSSRNQVCEDWDVLSEIQGLDLATPRLQAATAGMYSSCKPLKAWCAWLNQTQIRAMCPVTCGCASVVDPPAGFFASPAWGCPMQCAARIKAAMGMFSAGGETQECEDFAPEEFSTRPALRTYIQGFRTYFLSLMESGGIVLSMKNQILKLQKQLNIPLELVNSTADHILDGRFWQKVMNGVWEFADGVPHPRNAAGCKFWTSWEVTMVLGTDLCLVHDFRSLRMFCPESCHCEAEHEECPLTCPQR